MAFTNYTIVPSAGTVVIDGAGASPVSMVGIPADVHAIQWYGLQNIGTIEYKADPATGITPPGGTFTDPADYVIQTTEAEIIIYAFQNPQYYYSTINGNVVGGETFNLGQIIVITTPNTPQPADTTILVPPTLAESQELYWYANAWVASSVDPNLSLADAKTYLNNAILRSSTRAMAHQAGIHTIVQLITAANVSSLDTADYSGVTLGDYQTYLNGEVSTLQGIVNAATTVEDLYSFNPSVDPDPT